MNLILLYKKDFISKDKVRIADYRYKHIINVLRSKKGDRLCIGLENDRIGYGEVCMINSAEAELKIELRHPPPKALEAKMVLALPRPIVLNRILLTLASLGIKRIYLIQSSRVEKSYWRSPVLTESNIKKQLIFGLEQAKDTIVPKVFLFDRFKPFVEDKLPLIIKGTRALVAHPESDKDFPVDLKPPATIIIGPEGGFIPYEIELLEKNGIVPIKFGERILKVETFIPSIIAKLLY